MTKKEIRQAEERFAGIRVFDEIRDSLEDSCLMPLTCADCKEGDRVQTALDNGMIQHECSYYGLVSDGWITEHEFGIVEWFDGVY